MASFIEKITNSIYFRWPDLCFKTSCQFPIFNKLNYFVREISELFGFWIHVSIRVISTSLCHISNDLILYFILCHISNDLILYFILCHISNDLILYFILCHISNDLILYFILWKHPHFGLGLDNGCLSW